MGENFIDPSAQDPVQVPLRWYEDALRQRRAAAEGGAGPFQDGTLHLFSVTPFVRITSKADLAKHMDTDHPFFLP